MLLWLCVCCGVARGQEPDEEVVRLRVSSVTPQGTVVVDRGSTDGLIVGDTVTFLPRGGRRPRGRVLQVDDRSSIVELFDARISVPPGTRGQVAIPNARRPARGPKPRNKKPKQTPAKPGTPGTQTSRGASQGAAPLAQEQASKDGVGAAQEEAPGVGDDATDGKAADEGDEYDWELDDDEWEPGMPLLARVDSIRPDQRPLRITGRTYAIGEQIWTTESQRSTTTFRTGGSVALENPFGDGGRLQADAELNYQDATVPDFDDTSTGRLRIDRLSYARGGTRFQSSGWEAGRFLQRGLPEFGVLDGFEYGVRGSNGHRFGASVGFMPEPDNRFSTADDFQVAGYYRWIGDDSEELAATAGYQKSWHNGDADRDLFVGKAHFLPVVGWNYDATVWLDLYTDGDDQKPLLEVTQAFVRAGYREKEGGVDATFTHLAFPQIDRNEFRPVLDQQLAEDRRDRISLDGWLEPSRTTRVRVGAGIWNDEEETGGDAEAGIDVDNLFFDGNRVGFTVFGTEGAYTTLLGTRVQFGANLDNGRWELMYEYSNNEREGFDSGNDELLQSWLRATREFWTDSGWNVSLSADYFDYELESSYSIGIYVQKSF